MITRPLQRSLNVFLLAAFCCGASPLKKVRQGQLRDLIGCLYRYELYGDAFPDCWDDALPLCRVVSESLPKPFQKAELLQACRGFAPPADAKPLRELLFKHFKVDPKPNLVPKLEEGRRLYVAQCQGCHGENGANGVFASRFKAMRWRFDDKSLGGRIFPAMLHHFIAEGASSRGMPSFQGKLTVDELWDISHYAMTRFPGAALPKVAGRLTLTQLSQLTNPELAFILSAQGVCSVATGGSTCEGLATSWRRVGVFQTPVTRQ